MEFLKWRLIFTSAFPHDISLALWVYYMLKTSVSLKLQFQFLIVVSGITKRLFLPFIKSFHVACLLIKQLLNSWAFFF